LAQWFLGNGDPDEDPAYFRVFADSAHAGRRRRIDHCSVHVSGLPRRQLTPLATGVWFALALVYVLVQLGRRLGFVSGWLDWYLADLICLPLLLGLVLIVQRSYRHIRSWTLPHWHGLVAAATYGVYFELILPHFKSGVVGDPRDILSYLLGWLLFELLINRPVSV